MGRVYTGIFAALLLTSTLALPSRRTRGNTEIATNNFVGDGTNELATAILQGYVDSEKNLAFSPLGYSAQLAILAEGSRGETRNQLVNALHLPEDPEVTREAYKAVLSRLTEKNLDNYPEFRNWFYIYKNYSVEPEFKAVLQKYYLTDVRDVDRLDKGAVKEEAESMKKPEPVQAPQTDMSEIEPEKSEDVMETEKVDMDKEKEDDSTVPEKVVDSMMPEESDEMVLPEKMDVVDKIPEKIEDSAESAEIMQVSEMEEDYKKSKKNGPMKVVFPIPFPEKLKLRKLHDEREASPSGEVMTMQEEMLGNKKDEKIKDAMENEKKDDEMKEINKEDKKDDEMEKIKDDTMTNEKKDDKMEEMKDDVMSNEKKDEKTEEMKDDVMSNEKKDDKIEENKDDMMDNKEKGDKMEEMKDEAAEDKKKGEKIEKIKAEIREELLSIKKELEGSNEKKDDKVETIKDEMNNDKIEEMKDDKMEVPKEEIKDDKMEEMKDDKIEEMKDENKDEIMKDDMKENEKKESLPEEMKDEMVKDEIKKEEIMAADKDKKDEDMMAGVMMEEEMRVDPMKEEALISQAIKEQKESMVATDRKARYIDMPRLSREDHDVTSGLSSNNIVRKDAESNSVSQMLVFNGLYFKGIWATPFVQQKEDSFYKSDSEKSTVTMMSTQGSFRVGNIPELDSVAIELPYKGGRYSLMVMKPNSRTGLRQLISDLTGYSLRNIQKYMELQEVEVCLPSFEIQTTTKPIQALNKFGVSDIFSKEQADLSGISKDSGLFVEELVQLVTVRVDNGSGSYNLLTAGNPSTRSGLSKYVADQPFLYFVRDVVDNLIVVAGKVVDPSVIPDDP